jgi:hypothetical protein
MVEDGNGVSHATGVADRSHDGQSRAVGAAIGQLLDDAVDNVSARPPTTPYVGLVVIDVPMLLFKRAF